MPDDTAFLLCNSLLCGFYAEILVWSANLFDTSLIDEKVVNNLKEPGLFTETLKLPIEERGVCRSLFFGFPFEVILLWCLDDPIPEPGGFVPGDDKLNGGEELLDKFCLLVPDILSDPFA